MRLFSDIEYEAALQTYAFNTGTPVDLQNGRYEVGYDGGVYLNGGFGSQIIAIEAMNGRFKSTVAASLQANLMGLYDELEWLIYDTEDSISKDRERVRKMGEYGEIAPERIIWLDGVEYDLDGLLKFLYTKICVPKEKNKKDFIVETPFMDVTTGRRLQMWKPTIVFIDSMSDAYCALEEEILLDEKRGLASSVSQTGFLKDGNKKTLFIRQMRRLCQKYGIMLVATAHYDKNSDIGDGSGFSVPQPKQMQFGKQGYQAKGTGSKFKFTPTLYYRTESKLLNMPDKETMYPLDKTTAATDINLVDLLLQRVKTNVGGTSFPLVISQRKGLLTAVTNFHYLKSSGYFGFTSQNNQRQQLLFMPEVTLTRTTVRKLTDADPKLRRALQISAELCYIQNQWDMSTMPDSYRNSPEKVFDVLDKQKDICERILLSRGHWHYDDKHPQEMLTTPMIVKILTDEKLLTDKVISTPKAK